MSVTKFFVVKVLVLLKREGIVTLNGEERAARRHRKPNELVCPRMTHGGKLDAEGAGRLATVKKLADTCLIQALDAKLGENCAMSPRGDKDECARGKCEDRKACGGGQEVTDR